jgi:hypothetical protein
MARHSLIAALTAVFAYLFTDMLVWRLPLDFGVIIVLAALVVVLWLREKVWTNAPAWSMLLRYALIFYLLAFLVTATFSISLERSSNELVLLVISMIALVLTSELAMVWPPHIFLAAMRNASWLLIVVIAFVTLFRAATGGDARPPSPNVLAAVFNLLLLPSLVEFVERPRRALAIWIIAALALVFVTSSRGGWFGLAAGLVTLAAHYRARMAAVWSRARRFWPLMVPVGAVAVILQITRPNGIRWDFWIMATAIFLRRPLLGAGPGTFNLFWSHLYPPPIFQAMHAHSMIFNTAAEQGIVGLIALALMALAVLRAAWRDVGLFAAVMAFAAHSLVDSLNAAPAVMITLAVLLGSRLGGLSHEHRLRTEMSYLQQVNRS